MRSIFFKALWAVTAWHRHQRWLSPYGAPRSGLKHSTKALLLVRFAGIKNAARNAPKGAKPSPIFA